MAVDEAILEAYAGADPKPAPTLRLYGWSPATLSLGRSQPSQGSHDPRVLAREGIGLVRRPTGGAGVLHEHERTYAVIGALGAPPFPRGVVATYRAVAEALRSGLSKLGIDALPTEPRPAARRPEDASCFSGTGAWELVVAGRKIVGSAQARRHGAFLQHGAVPIRLEPGRLGSVMGAPVDGSRFVSLEEASGRPITTDEVDRALIAGFEATFGTRCVAGELTAREALRAAELRCWKYDSMSWTYGGTIGGRETRWGPAIR